MERLQCCYAITAIATAFCDDPVNLVGIGHATGAVELYGRKSLTTMPAVAKAAQESI